jgi:hypothetical protein
MINTIQKLFPLISRLSSDILQHSIRADKPKTNVWEFQTSDGMWHELQFTLFSESEIFKDAIEIDADKRDNDDKYHTVTQIYLCLEGMSRPYPEIEFGKVKIIILREEEINTFNLISDHLQRDKFHSNTE